MTATFVITVLSSPNLDTFLLEAASHTVMIFYTNLVDSMYLLLRGAQILGTRSSLQLNFVEWCQLIVSSQYGTFLVSPFWHLEF